MADIEIPLSAPDITDADRDAVMEVLRGRDLSRGPVIEKFERRIAGLTGRREAVAVSSGTAALHLAAIVGGIGPGDEVLTTPFSFVASANVILYCGATPVFADIDPLTLNVDVDHLAECIGEKTRAVVAVHALGRAADILRIEALCRQFDLGLIEDASEAIGGVSDDRRLGSFGDASTFAFYPNKQITGGEGGVLLTDDAAAAERARSLRNQGRDPDRPGYRELGYNYRWTDIQAALALSQLERLPAILARRREVADGYRRRLGSSAALILPEGDPGTSWFVYVVRLRDDAAPDARDRVLAGLRERGIGCARYFEPIHLQKFYRERFGFEVGDYPVTEHVAVRTIALPFFNRISEAEQDRVADTLLNLV